MKNVKIATFHRANSHGALLQAASLHRYISTLGYNVEFIDYSVRNIPQWPQFRAYADEYLPRTANIDTFSQLEDMDADILVCGSDQIWNLDITLSGNPDSRWDFIF